MEVNELKKCKKCGNTERVWYEGYCEKCYGEIYKQKQIEQDQNKQENENKIIYDSNIYTSNSSKSQLGMKWFNFFKIIMIFSLVVRCLNSFNGFIQDIMTYDNSIIVLVSFINFGFCYYQYVVYRDLKNEKENSVDNLLIFLTINFFLLIINEFMKEPYESSFYFLGYFLGASTFYIPNLIYFYKRKDIYRNKGEKI